jgi:hypothetical protein
MQTISIPITEYQSLTYELELLKNSDFMQKLNRLIDLMYADKYGLFLNDYTDDLTEYSLNSSWKNESSVWDKI